MGVPVKKEKHVTWDELARIYDAHSCGRPARTLPMDAVFTWAEHHPELFRVTKDGCLVKRSPAKKEVR